MMVDESKEPEGGHLSDLFPHEAYDFTPWLADHLHLLGDELELKLKPIRTEEPVGPYFLDILAEETSRKVQVAIENQLKWTNTHHLGQLLTYATGCDAKIAIWVASEFCYEHAQALHKLNEWTDDGIGFYGVRVEAVRPTRKSPSEAGFRKVVWPGGWDKTITLESNPPKGQEYEAFFRPLVARLVSAGFTDQPPHKRWGHSGRFFRSPRNPGVYYAPSFARGAVWVTVHIETADNTLTKQIFDALEADRHQIEKAVTPEGDLSWRWNRHNRWNYSSINIRNDGSVHHIEQHDQIRSWMISLLDKLQEVFDPRVAEVLKPTQPDLEQA